MEAIKMNLQMHSRPFSIVYKHSISCLYQIVSMVSNTLDALRTKIIFKLRLFFSSTCGFSCSTCVAWVLDSIQSLYNSLMFQRCCAGRRGTFKTHKSHQVRDMVISGDGPGQMFLASHRVTHRWPLVLCAVAQRITILPDEFSIMVRSGFWYSPRCMSSWEGRVQMEKILALAFVRGSGVTYQNCHCLTY